MPIHGSPHEEKVLFANKTPDFGPKLVFHGVHLKRPRNLNDSVTLPPLNLNDLSTLSVKE